MTDAFDAGATDAAREFRPSWPAFHRRLLARSLLLGPLFLVIVLITTWPSIGLALVMFGAVFAVGGLALAVYFWRMRVRLDASSVAVRGAFRTRSWNREQIAATVLVPQLVPAGVVSTGAVRESLVPVTLYAVSPLHERLFRLSGGFWERAALEELAEAIGAPLVPVPLGLPAREIQERYPGTVGWTAVHPWLYALLLAASAAVTVFVLVVVATAVLLATGQLQLPPPG